MSSGDFSLVAGAVTVYRWCVWACEGFPGGAVGKNLPMQETQVRSLGLEDPLEKEVAICCSILAWKIPQTEEPGGLQFMKSQRGGHRLAFDHAP